MPIAMSRLLLLVAVALAALLVTDTSVQAQPLKLKRKVTVYKEPRPDMSVPVVAEGQTKPSFEPLAESALLRRDRTGTYGGTLVYSVVSEVETFNPVEPKGATSQECRRILFSGLLSYSNGDWKHEPELAESWVISEDKKSWTFKIRQGVRWSDGEPLEIDDVEFSFRCAFDDRYKTSIQSIFRNKDGGLPTIEVVDERHIRLTTQYPMSQFLTSVGNVMMIPRHQWEKAYEDGSLLQQMTNDTDPLEIVGTGPFCLKRYDPAEKIEFVRNPYYFKVDARGERLPYLDRVVLAIVKDLNTQWQKYEAGEHDLLDDLPPDHYREAVDLEKGKPDEFEVIRLGLQLNTYWSCFNLHPGQDPETGEPYVSPEKRRWFTNLKFRQAFNHALNRKALVKVGFEGRGAPIYSSITRGNKAWFNPSVKAYEHSTEKANALLDELGWTDRDGDGIREDDQGKPLRFRLYTNVENPIRVQMGAQIQGHLKKAGVKLDFKPISFNDLVTSLQDGHRWDMILLGWGSGVPPDPSNSKSILLSSGRLHAWHPLQTQAATEWEARIDELVGRMDSEFDEKLRKQLSDEIQEIIAEQCPLIYMVAPNAYSMAKKRVGNVWPSVLRPSTTWNLEELYIKSPRPAQ